MTQRTPGNPALKVLVVLTCIGAIGAGVMALTSQKPIPKEALEAQQQAIGQVCRGVGVPEAAPYGRRIPHPIVLLSSSGQTHEWSAWIPSDWQPPETSSTELVACVGKEEAILMQTCDYVGGLPVERYWYEVGVNLMETRTGRLFTTFAAHGDPPAACPKIAPQILTRLNGSRVRFDDVKGYLWSYVESLRQRTWRGLTRFVRSVAWSPDGKILASGGEDGLVQLRDASSGEVLRTLGERLGTLPPVVNLAWSPGETRLAARYRWGIVILWDVRSGEPAAVLREKSEAYGAGGGASDGLDTLAWSPDGATLATGFPDGSVTLWDAAKGEALRSVRAFSRPIVGVAWSPGGETLAIASSYEVILWQLAAGKQQLALEEQDGMILGVAFSPDGTMLAAGSSYGSEEGVILWNAMTGEQLRTLEVNSSGVSAVAWSPDGKMVAAGHDGDGFVRVWDANTGALASIEKDEAGGVLSVAFSPDGMTLASGSEDGTIILWGVEPVESPSQPFPQWVSVLIVVAGTALIGFVLFGSAFWVLADAQKRGKSGCLWSLFALLTFPLGLIIYLLQRNRSGAHLAEAARPKGELRQAASAIEPKRDEAGQAPESPGGAGGTAERPSQGKGPGRIKCPSCGYENAPTRLTCKVCRTQLKAPPG